MATAAEMIGQPQIVRLIDDGAAQLVAHTSVPADIFASTGLIGTGPDRPTERHLSF